MSVSVRILDTSTEGTNLDVSLNKIRSERKRIIDVDKD